jgi:hypothetical protein
MKPSEMAAVLEHIGKTKPEVFRTAVGQLPNSAWLLGSMRDAGSGARDA